jgi:hypothetical protein
MLWKVAWSPSLLFRVLGLIGIKYPEQQIVMNAMNSVRHGLRCEAGPRQKIDAI